MTTLNIVTPDMDVVNRFMQHSIEDLECMRATVLSEYDSNNKFKTDRTSQLICNIETAIALLNGKKYAYITQAIAFKPSDLWRLDFIPGWYQIEADTLRSLERGKLHKDNPDIHGNYRMYQGFLKLV